jgi:hypothetical protein
MFERQNHYFGALSVPWKLTTVGRSLSLAAQILIQVIIERFDLGQLIAQASSRIGKMLRRSTVVNGVRRMTALNNVQGRNCIE